MKIKKILSGVIAVATLAASVGMFPVSAAYDVCDVNRDGVVNVRDVSAIASYLESKVCEPDYNNLDVNKSLIVDYMDEQYVFAKVMGQSYSSSYFSKKNRTTSKAPSVSNIVLNNDADS